MVLLKECSLVSYVNRSRVLSSWASLIESNHAIRFCSKSMHARIQCFSLILTGMSILEHVKMSTYLVPLAPRSSPSSTFFQKNGVAKKVLRRPSILFWFRLPCLVIE